MKSVQESRPKERKPKYEKPWLNAEGYHDPTAYMALRNIERTESRKRYGRNITK